MAWNLQAIARVCTFKQIPSKALADEWLYLRLLGVCLATCTCSACPAAWQALIDEVLYAKRMSTCTIQLKAIYKAMRTCVVDSRRADSHADSHARPERCVTRHEAFLCWQLGCNL